MTRRRSKLSATAPDAREKIMTGSEVDAWTSETMSADPAIEVISHAAPTDWMRPPRLEARLAAHTARKVEWLKGANGDGRSLTAFNSSTAFFDDTSASDYFAAKVGLRRWSLLRAPSVLPDISPARGE